MMSARHHKASDIMERVEPYIQNVVNISVSDKCEDTEVSKYAEYFMQQLDKAYILVKEEGSILDVNYLKKLRLLLICRFVTGIRMQRHELSEKCFEELLVVCVQDMRKNHISKDTILKTICRSFGRFVNTFDKERLCLLLEK